MSPTLSRRLLPLLALIVVIVSGCSSVPAAGSMSSGARNGRTAAPRVALPTPGSLVRGGVTYRVAKVAPAAAMLDRQQPDQLRLFVFEAENKSYPECAQLSPSARVVGEDAQTVFVAAFAYRKPAKSTHEACIDSESVNSPPPYATLRLRLHAPLGSRALIDVKTGEPIGIATNQEPPMPSFVPTGYRQTVVERFNASSSFVANREFQSGQKGFGIRVMSATVWSQRLRVTGHTDIGGHAATIAVWSHLRCLTWADDQRMIRELCSATSDRDDPLTEKDLERIASSLPK